MVDSFRGRPLGSGSFLYMLLDALTQEVREDGRRGAAVATGVNRQGKRELLGLDVGTSKNDAFWRALLRSPASRGLHGVELLTSEAHQGLNDAIATFFADASWQCCHTHFMTNLLSRVFRMGLDLARRARCRLRQALTRQLALRQTALARARRSPPHTKQRNRLCRPN